MNERRTGLQRVGGKILLVWKMSGNFDHLTHDRALSANFAPKNKFFPEYHLPCFAAIFLFL